MKKLLALLVVGGLLGLTTGCPPTTTSKTSGTTGTKGGSTTSVSTVKTERGGDHKGPEDRMDKKEGTGTGTKIEKKEEKTEKKDGTGTKTEKKEEKTEKKDNK
jgi:hypothetical protein